MKIIRTTTKSGVSAFIDGAIQYGLTKFVCSPGSRNAPIVIALDEHPEIQTIVIHDERVAAFYALGMAQELNVPVGVVCTSGSAMLNYYPAVAEAYYRNIPLVVLSADRPSEWVNHGDGQTIVQEGVYTNHIQWEGVIQETISEEESLKKLLHEAFEAALSGWKGPIHFNFPLTEPLYGTLEKEYQPKEKKQFEKIELSLTDQEKQSITSAWNTHKKKLILCGQLDKNLALINELKQLANDPSVAVLVENTSNLTDQSWVHCIDRTLAGIDETEIESYQPDLLLTIGGAVVSKRIKQFLRKSSIVEHWKVGCDFPEMDTYRKLTKSVQCEAEDFLAFLNTTTAELPLSNFGAKWKQLDFEVQAKLDGFFQTIPYSDLAVFELLLDYIPENAKLHMANSSVVRYCQLFDPISSIRYYANRGTSGIDGSTSTACGAALAGNGCHVLITGDVSFFYDSNALWSASLPPNLRIFLINNSGGGIFRIIEGPNCSPQLEKYFEAKHTTKAEFICRAHGVEYCQADTLESIENQLADFFSEDSDVPKLMEIVTPNEVNAPVLQSFFNRIKK